MTAPTVELPPLASPIDELWHVLLDLGEELTVGWALIGGQMVLLHTLEHGRVPPQISQDGDVVADVRTRPSASMMSSPPSRLPASNRTFPASTASPTATRGRPSRGLSSLTSSAPRACRPIRSCW